MLIGVKKNKRLKVILDANWYISACISRKSRRTVYYQILKNTDLQLFYSQELVAEFDDVINRPKFAKIVTAKQVSRFKSIILKFLNRTTLGTLPDLVRDKNDNYLLGICAGCQADFLITGDNDLLVLEEYQKTKILSMGQFLLLLSTIKS
ncbi:putative toxin-antitoxin system toxin component, PIN family [Larkinella terrae]